MTTVVLTVHVLIVLALIGVVLLQRSDGSALGIGGGSSGGFMTGAGAADALTRTTSILAALFFATSIGLAIFASPGESADEIIEELTGEEQRDPNATPTTDDLLRTLGGGDSDAPSSDEPASDEPVSDAAAEAAPSEEAAPAQPVEEAPADTPAESSDTAAE